MMPESALRFLPRSRVSICIASMCVASGLSAAPVAPEVMHGSADFIRQGDHLEISNSDGAIINWQDFSIAAHESVNFLQTHASSAILNRVISNIPSDILGELTSNGRVFVINPNGLVIGKDAIIDTAGFVGSTLNITDEDFIAGRMKFVGDSGEIENHGYIAAGPGGDVILIAPDIENHGVIEADDGQILLTAGREVTLHSMQSGGLSYRVSAPGDKALNIGQLVAANGSVKVFADQIFQQGDISATRATRAADGSIILEADNAIKVSGSLDAGGDGVAGGDIHVLGKQVDVEGAKINASGESGGEILIGGDYAGEGEVKNAANTNVDESTVITADAGKNGAGGRVIVWSDNTTNSFAKITAKGGELSGDGGFVETSGKKTLNFGQAVDVSANNGAAGTWLLDPEDIVIDEAGASSIETSLNGGSNVEVRTSDEGDGEGNITVAAPITKTEGDSAVTLTLDAHNRVDVNAPITTTAGPLNVDIKTGRQVASVDVSEENESLEEELQGEGDDSPEGGESVVVEEATDNGGEGEELGEPTEATETAESDEVADQGSDQSVDEGGSATAESDEESESTESAEESESSEELVAEQSDVDDGAPIDDAPEVDDSGVDDSVVEEPAVEVEEAIADVDDAPQELEEVAEQPAEEVVEEQEVAIEAEEVVTEVEEAVAEVEEVEEAVDEVVEEVVAQADEAVEESVSANQDSGFIDTQEQQIVIAADIFTGGGEVTIDAGEGGDVIIVADIDTSDHDGDLAGDITVEADNIAIVGDAEVDASDEVAGEIQIGGGQQGQDPDIDNADIVIIGEDATISADGGENGDGGRVIVFSEQASIISGNLSAQGGSQSGNGGFIETSGLRGLVINGTPNVTASNGNSGTWLIDPTDITITSGEASSYAASNNVDNIITYFPDVMGGNLDRQQVNISDIRGALSNGSNVIIDTTGSPAGDGQGNITFDGVLEGGSGASYAELTGSLTLNAYNNIYFEGTIDTNFESALYDRAGELDITFNAYGSIYLDSVYNPPGSPSVSSIFTAGNISINAGYGEGNSGNVVNSADLATGGSLSDITIIANGGAIQNSPLVYNESGYGGVITSGGDILLEADLQVENTGRIESFFSTVTINSGEDSNVVNAGRIRADEGVYITAGLDVLNQGGERNSSDGNIYTKYGAVEITADRNVDISGSSSIRAGGYVFGFPGSLDRSRVAITSNAEGEYSGNGIGGDGDGVVRIHNDGARLRIFTGIQYYNETDEFFGGTITFQGSGVEIRSTSYLDAGGSSADSFGQINIGAANIFIGANYGEGLEAIDGNITISAGAENPQNADNLFNGSVDIDAIFNLDVVATESILIESADTSYGYAGNLPPGQSQPLVESPNQEYSVSLSSYESVAVSASDVTVSTGAGGGSSIELVARGDADFQNYEGTGELFINATNLTLDGSETIDLYDANTGTVLATENGGYLTVLGTSEVSINVENNLTMSGFSRSDLTDTSDVQQERAFTSTIASFGDLYIDVENDLRMDGGEILVLSENYNPPANELFGENGREDNVDEITVENLLVNNGRIVFDRDQLSSNESFAPGELVLTTAGQSIIGNDSGSDPFDFSLQLSSVTWNQEGSTEWISGDLIVDSAPVLFASSTNGDYLAQARNSEINIADDTEFLLHAEGQSFTFTLNDESPGTIVNEGRFGRDQYIGNSESTVNLNFILANTGEFYAGAGTINFQTGGLDQSAGETILRGGNITVGNDGTGVNFTGGALRGGTSYYAGVYDGGTINSDVTVQNTTVDPGFSPGTLTINGDFDASGGGNTFLMDVNYSYANNSPGANYYDQLIITGNAVIPNTDVNGINGINQVVASGYADFYVAQAPTTSNSYYGSSFQVIQADGAAGAIADLVTQSNVSVNVYGPGVEGPDGASYSYGVGGATYTGVNDFNIFVGLTVEAPPVVEPPVVEPPVVEPPVVEPPTVEPPTVEPPTVEPPTVEPPTVEPPTVEPPTVEPPTVEPPTVEPPTVEPPTVEPPTVEPPTVEPPTVEPPTVEPPEVIVVIIDEQPVVLPPDIVDVLVTLTEEERRAFLESERVRDAIKTVNMCAAEV